MEESLKNPEILRQIILDNYQYPNNKGLVEDDRYKKIHMASDSCIDDLFIQVLIEDDMIKDVRFDGVGCAISTASTSIISELIKGKSVNDAKNIINEYYKMVDNQEADYDILEEAYAFVNVGKQANRIKCATIGINGMSSLIKEFEDE
ncbi:MAG: SUF system NifU family Fe-S cluster assembly protein [Erysipelotrichaceae bacterium]